jgi:branched-chain amino acid transport system substrate-binding protein
MAVDDINKAGGIKAMGGAKLDPLWGDSQSKVEVGRRRGREDERGGRRRLHRLLPEPGRHRRQPGGIEVQHAVPDRRRRLRPDRESRAQERVPLKPGFGVCVDQGIAALGALNKAAGGPAKSAVIVHESGEFGTGTAKLLAGKLPGIGIEAKEVIAHDNPTRNFDNIALRIRSVAPDIVMMSNYRNEYVLLARTLFQQKINLAGMFSVLGGGFNYKFAKEQPEVSQYMMDTNHWYNPKSEKAQALKKRVEAAGKEFTFEVYLAYTVVGLLADFAGTRRLGRQGEADRRARQLDLQGRTDALRPTKFVNGQNEGAKAAVLQANKGDIQVIAPEEFAEVKAVFPSRSLRRPQRFETKPPHPDGASRSDVSRR